MSATLSDELRYRLLKLLMDQPNASQREVAASLGISVGKVNYCVRALIEKGLVKAQNFKNSRQKSAYLYLLTPSGVEQKLLLACEFLQRKLTEYDSLSAQIEQLRAEIAASESPRSESGPV